MKINLSPVIAILTLFSSTILFADLVTIPTSLSPGDSYRLAFVTSGARDAHSLSIADYNDFVQSAADATSGLSALGTIWKAIGSTSTIDARDNTGTLPSIAGGSLGVPIFRIDDTKIADSNDDLWDGTLDFDLHFTETETYLTSSAFTWTGTKSDGTADAFPLGAAAGSLIGNGRPIASTSAWVDFSVDFSQKPKRFYAISSVLTVPVPEPSSVIFFIATILFIPKRSR